MFQITGKTPVYIVARFIDSRMAELARNTITETLDHAEKEVQSLFERQGGIADSLDVGRIYERHGFSNDCGWSQSRPLSTSSEDLFWELPEGLAAEEAENLLVALGAVSVSIRGASHDEMFSCVPHPAAIFLSEMADDAVDFDEDELLFVPPTENKKILH